MKLTEASVYEILRNKIINLEYKPGQELKVNELAEELDVSRSPIRDALLRLSMDKLVDIFPQRGTRVSFLDKEIIRQERFMRVNLELGILKLFMEKATDKNKRDIYSAKLNAILLQQQAALLDGNKKEFLESDNKMHKLFYEETDNIRVWDVMASNTGNDHRIRILSYNEKDIEGSVEDEHKNLVSAIENGEVQKVIEIDKFHLEKVNLLVDKLEITFPEYFGNKIE